jgi:hypothetical protein
MNDRKKEGDGDRKNKAISTAPTLIKYDFGECSFLPNVVAPFIEKLGPLSP